MIAMTANEVEKDDLFEWYREQARVDTRADALVLRFKKIRTILDRWGLSHTQCKLEYHTGNWAAARNRSELEHIAERIGFDSKKVKLGTGGISNQSIPLWLVPCVMPNNPHVVHARAEAATRQIRSTDRRTVMQLAQTPTQTMTVDEMLHVIKNIMPALPTVYRLKNWLERFMEEGLEILQDLAVLDQQARGLKSGLIPDAISCPKKVGGEAWPSEPIGEPGVGEEEDLVPVGAAASAAGGDGNGTH